MSKRLTITVDELLTGILVTGAVFGASATLITSELNNRRNEQELAFRRAHHEERVEGFTPAYNRFVAALGEEVPEPITQEWLDGHNARVESAFRGLRGTATRSDESTSFDRAE
jgi:hypothetical protein